MVPAIEIASQSVTNRSSPRASSGIVQNVREGEPLWRSLDNDQVVSDLAIEMIKVGESTGALTEMLANVQRVLRRGNRIPARPARRRRSSP